MSKVARVVAEERLNHWERAELERTGRVALTERERVVIKWRRDGLTLWDIGDELGISRERVRQVLWHANWKRTIWPDLSISL